MTSIASILIVGDVGDCWEAYVAGGLKRIPKELVLAADQMTAEVEELSLLPTHTPLHTAHIKRNTSH